MKYIYVNIVLYINFFQNQPEKAFSTNAEF